MLVLFRLRRGFRRVCRYGSADTALHTLPRSANTTVHHSLLQSRQQDTHSTDLLFIQYVAVPRFRLCYFCIAVCHSDAPYRLSQYRDIWFSIFTQEIDSMAVRVSWSGDTPPCSVRSSCIGGPHPPPSKSATPLRMSDRPVWSRWPAWCTCSCSHCKDRLSLGGYTVLSASWRSVCLSSSFP